MKNLSLIVSAFAFCLSSAILAEVAKQPRIASAGTMNLPMQKPSVDDLVAFLTMEKGHKEDWLNFAKKKHEEKYDLLIKHHDEMFDSHIEHVKQMAEMNGFSSRQDAINSKLQDMISMHETHMQEWKTMCDNDRAEAEALYTRHKTELDAFKASHGQQSIKAPQWSKK